MFLLAEAKQACSWYQLGEQQCALEIMVTMGRKIHGLHRAFHLVSLGTFSTTQAKYSSVMGIE